MTAFICVCTCNHNLSVLSVDDSKYCNTEMKVEIIQRSCLQYRLTVGKCTIKRVPRVGEMSAAQWTKCRTLKIGT